MKTKDFDYYLPEELIAQTPLEKRDESRLMCLDKETGELSHHHFYELPDFLNPGDCLILNNSRVLPARLLGQRLPGGGACEGRPEGAPRRAEPRCPVSVPLF